MLYLATVIKKYPSTSSSLAFFKYCVKRRLFDLFSAAAKGQQEITITAGQTQYCFDGLSPDSLYNATVFVQTPNLEGPGVSTKERTREFRLYPEMSRYSSSC